MFMFQLENPPFCNNPSCGKREKKGKGREKKETKKKGTFTYSEFGYQNGALSARCEEGICGLQFYLTLATQHLMKWAYLGLCGTKAESKKQNVLTQTVLANSWLPLLPVRVRGWRHWMIGSPNRLASAGSVN